MRRVSTSTARPPATRRRGAVVVDPPRLSVRLIVETLPTGPDATYGTSVPRTSSHGPVWVGLVSSTGVVTVALWGATIVRSGDIRERPRDVANHRGANGAVRSRQRR